MSIRTRNGGIVLSVLVVALLGPAVVALGQDAPASQPATRSGDGGEGKGEIVVLQDPLQGKTIGQQRGGRFTPEGFQPQRGTGHILYRLPATVREGYLEFQVKGMDHQLVPKGGDHGFAAMYDGRGIEEDCTYTGGYKENFYRWNVHWRQDRAAMKIVISCAKEQNRLAGARAVYRGNRDWSTEPTGKGVKWDPDKWYTIRMEWKDKLFRVLMDGTEIVKASGPNDYAPVEHRVWIGCAPGQGNKYPCLVPEIVYRNVRLVSYAPVAPFQQTQPAGEGEQASR